MMLGFICFIMASSLMAQKDFKEATLVYQIDISSQTGKQEIAKTLDGATLTVYLKAGQSKSEMVNALGTETTLYDARTTKGAILKSYSGQKLMITLNAANWAQKNKYFHELAFNVDNATETINGFTCKKATAQLPEGKSIVVYFAPDLVPTNNDYNNAFSQLPGLPVRYQVESGKLLFTYNLQRIGYESIPATTFDLPKTGYRIMTYEENQQLRKGGK